MFLCGFVATGREVPFARRLSKGARRAARGFDTLGPNGGLLLDKRQCDAVAAPKRFSM
jgi:hypothetical protein